MKQRIILTQTIPISKKKVLNRIDLIDEIAEEIRKQNPLPMRRAFIDFYWIEKTIERPLDQIVSNGREILIPAIVKSGIIKANDRKCIIGFRDNHSVNRSISGIHLYFDDYATITDSDRNEAFTK